MESRMGALVNECQVARDSASRRRRVPFDEKRLLFILDACEQALIALAPEGKRVRSTTEADNRTHEFLEPIYEDLVELLTPAHYEISLRVLLLTVMRASRDAYEADLRLPAWDRAIGVAEAEVAKAVEAWQACAEARERQKDSCGD